MRLTFADRRIDFSEVLGLGSGIDVDV